MPTKNKKPNFGEDLIEVLEEVRAWRRGELELEVVTINTMPPERIKAIRKRVARSTKEFERRFGVPASTMNNWEQGRREPDIPSRLLLKVIEVAPDVVEKAAQS